MKIGPISTAFLAASIAAGVFPSYKLVEDIFDHKWFASPLLTLRSGMNSSEPL